METENLFLIESQSGQKLRVIDKTEQFMSQITMAENDFWSKLVAVIQMGLPKWSSGKESTYHCRNEGSIPGSGRTPGVENSNPLQYTWIKDLGSMAPPIRTRPSFPAQSVSAIRKPP